MINTELIHYEQFTIIGEKEYDDCKTNITFDCDNLIITSCQDNQELCSILIDLTPRLINELKALIAALDANNSSI